MAIHDLRASGAPPRPRRGTLDGLDRTSAGEDPAPSEQCQDAVLEAMHPRRISRTSVVVPAQMQAAVDGVQYQFGAPIVAAGSGLAPGDGLAEDQLPVDLATAATTPEIEAEYVGAARIPLPAGVLPPHLRLTHDGYLDAPTLMARRPERAAHRRADRRCDSARTRMNRDVQARRPRRMAGAKIIFALLGSSRACGRPWQQGYGSASPACALHADGNAALVLENAGFSGA